MTVFKANHRPARGAFASLAGFAVVAALAVAAPVSAQVLGSAPYAPRPDPAMERLDQRINTLEDELRRMTGQNEQLNFQLNAAKRSADEANASRDQMRRDFDALLARVSQLEALARGDVAAQQGVATQPGEAVVNLTQGPSANSGLASVSTEAAAPAARVDLSALPQDEAGFMKEARNLLLSGDYPAAHAAFSHFLATYPKSPMADEAQYQVGEALLYQNNYADAVTAYRKIISDYPKSDRGPEALVKLARSLRLMDKGSEACKVLGLMSTNFPKASSATKALASTEKTRAKC